MSEQERHYYMMVKACGAIEQRIAFYLEKANELFEREGEGSTVGLLY